MRPIPDTTPVEEREPLQENPPRVEKKLLICSTPRSLSSTLCNYLAAAGFGNPDEYFLTTNMGRYAQEMRKGSTPSLAEYVDLLFATCSADGLFSSKLQFSQFHHQLTNDIGEALFDGATVVHLTRSDFRGQIASLIAAGAHGVWTDTERTKKDVTITEEMAKTSLLKTFDFLQREEAGWRAFFGYSGIRPLIITDQMIIEDVLGVVQKIAQALGREVDEVKLLAFHAQHRGKYTAQASDKAKIAGWIEEEFKSLAFASRSYRNVTMPRPWRGRWYRFKEKYGKL